MGKFKFDNSQPNHEQLKLQLRLLSVHLLKKKREELRNEAQDISVNDRNKTDHWKMSRAEPMPQLISYT